ncbi:hypothetical protein [Serratia liquefaciens]|uniref:hypothetical protein n=2 Tax=Serratia liquefaciens TaxID=614 RepID=UPI0007235F34|nr:hypothetical protein [Serratia liquefaciens]GAK27376.1 hypothetical protein SLIQ_11880 [Serratia liquefaciens FK01]
MNLIIKYINLTMATAQPIETNRTEIPLGAGYHVEKPTPAPLSKEEDKNIPITTDIIFSALLFMCSPENGERPARCYFL